MSLKETQVRADSKDLSRFENNVRSSMKWSSLLAKSVLKKAAYVVGFIFLWWAVTGMHLLPAFAVPSPSAVAKVTESSFSSLLSQSWVSAQRVIISVLAIWVIGAIVGVLIGMTPRMWPLLSLGRALYAVPIVVVYPLLGVWFGVGGTSKIVFGFVSGILPMSLMSAAAVRSIDENIYMLFASLRVSRASMFRRAVFPAALPGVISAMRLSGSMGLVSVVVGEMLLSANGIGYWISNAESQFEGPTLYEGIIMVLVFALILNGLVGFLERKVAAAYG
ncbi:MAG: ABC transporter permease subunit [Actinomycetota bacterium]|nr:MAG: ABC transporter permease subunit [Actinomycetota bacterium]